MAVDRFRSAVARDARFALAHAARGDALWLRYREGRKRDDADQAIVATERARSLDPDNPLVRLSLAGSYFGTGKNDAAIEELKEAVTLQPNNDDIRRMLGTVYARMGRTDEAAAHFDRATALPPGSRAAARAAYERAIELGRRMLDVNPADPGTMSLNAVCTAKLQRFEEARRLSERALQLAPEDPQVLFRAGAIEALASTKRERSPLSKPARSASSRCGKTRCRGRSRTEAAAM